jgi:hypothetical protein
MLYLGILKLFFVAMSITAVFLFVRKIKRFNLEDLGQVQKYVAVLLVLICFYNDPFFMLRKKIPYHLYYVWQAFFGSTFIAYQLFVWLVIVHSAATEE